MGAYTISYIYESSSDHMAPTNRVDNRVLIEMELNRIGGHLQAVHFYS